MTKKVTANMDTIKLLEAAATAISSDAGEEDVGFFIAAPIADGIKKPLLAKITERIGKDLNDCPKLGAGACGVAYNLGGGEALKITRDEAETYAAIKLMGKHNETIVDYYDLFEMRQNDKNTEPENKSLFGIVQEKLMDASSDFVNLANSWGMFRRACKRQKYWDLYSHGVSTKGIEKFTEWFDKEYDRGLYTQFAPMLGGFTSWLQSAADELASVNIIFMDVHGGNVMRRSDGGHVLIDLGGSNHPNWNPPAIDVISKRHRISK